ncbi:hypothetical protein FQA39_LY13026 [Lamprigera yunnana]|nr:hypothetical protein FQA39_LY13026 [Lamprigera yunnana]
MRQLRIKLGNKIWNFQSNRSFFTEELYKASKLIDIKNPNPIILGVYLEVTMNEVILISTNTSLSFKSILTASNSDLEITKPGKILIKPKYIIEILRKLEDDRISIVAVENNELRIKTRMNLKITNDSIYFFGTDLFRISQKKLKITNELNEEINIIIPFKTILELQKLLETAKDVKIIVSEGYITFVIDNILFQSNLIDGIYPNIESAIPTEFNTTILVESRKILRVLSRFEIAQDVTEKLIINLNISKDKMILKTSISEIGQFEEEFSDFQLEGNDELVINFNTKFLIDAIKTFGEETIELNFINSTRPLVINVFDQSDLKQIILPTFVNN